MKTCITLRNENDGSLPEGFTGPDVRFPPELARRFIEEYTGAGGVVFDPFAGFGTTLRAAEAAGRTACGVELDAARCDYARSRLRRPESLVCGDARRLASFALPDFDISLTSPPYTGRDDPEDPLTNYTKPHAAQGEGYAAYLSGIAEVYAQIARKLKPGARAVIEISNIKQGEHVTPLAWDVARTVSGVLPFEGEVVIRWEPTYGFGYDHSYCLVFRKPQGNDVTPG